MTFKNILFLSFLFFYGFVLILGLSFDWHYIWSHTGINFTSNTFPQVIIKNKLGIAKIKNETAEAIIILLLALLKNKYKKYEIGKKARACLA